MFALDFSHNRAQCPTWYWQPKSVRGTRSIGTHLHTSCMHTWSAKKNLPRRQVPQNRQLQRDWRWRQRLVTAAEQTSCACVTECMVTPCAAPLATDDGSSPETSSAVRATIHTGLGRPSHSHRCRGRPCWGQRGRLPRSPGTHLRLSLHVRPT